MMYNAAMSFFGADTLASWRQLPVATNECGKCGFSARATDRGVRMSLTDNITNETEEKVYTALSEAAGRNVEVIINSNGGSSFSGLAIMNMLLDYQENTKGSITTTVSGLAASAASVILQAGAQRNMQMGTRVMIHNVRLPMLMGNLTSSTLRTIATVLDKLSEDYASVYAIRSGRSVRELQKLMNAETFFSAHEAVSFGLADSVANPLRKDEQSSPAGNSRNTPLTGLAYATFIEATAGLYSRRNSNECYLQ